MNEEELIKNLKNAKYAPEPKTDERILQMLENLEENNQSPVTNSKNQSNKSQYNLLFSLFNMRMKNVALVAVPILAIGLVALFTYPTLLSGNIGGGLTAAQKQEIYKNILANNSQMQVKTTAENFRTAAGNAEADQQDVALNSKLVPLPGGEDNTGKIITSTFVNTPGASADECKAIFNNSATSPERTVSMSFYDSDGRSVSNYVEYFGDIQFVNQSYFDTTESVNVDYKGGKYAVRSIYEYSPQNRYELESSEGVGTPGSTSGAAEPAVDYMPLETEPGIEGEAEMDWEAKIKQYFGEDVDIVGTEEINGKTHYVLQFSYETPCDYAYSIMRTNVDYWNGESYEDTLSEQQGDTKKIVMRNYVDAEDFSVYKSDSFVGSATDANLIYSSITEVESRDASFEEAESEIMFDVNVPIREYTYENNTVEYNPEAENEKLVDFLIGEGYVFVDLPNTGYEMAGIFSNSYYLAPSQKDQYTEWVTSRDFYPDGEFGDEIMEIYNGYTTLEYKAPISSLVEYAYMYGGSEEVENRGLDLKLMIYENADDIEILNSMLYGPVTDKEMEDVQININGQMTAAKLYKYQTEYESYVYEEGMVEGSEGSIAPDTAVSNKMRIDPGIGGELENVTDSFYTIIVPMDGYKLVIRDMLSQSEEYPASLETVTTAQISVNELTAANRAQVLEAIRMEDVAMPVDIGSPEPAMR